MASKKLKSDGWNLRDLPWNEGLWKMVGVMEKYCTSNISKSHCKKVWLRISPFYEFQLSEELEIWSTCSKIVGKV